MPRLGLVLFVATIALAIGIGFLAANRTSLAANLPATGAEHQSVVLDQQNVVLDVAPMTSQPAVDSARAATAAATYLPAGNHPTGVRILYGGMTLLDGDGGIVRGMRSRPAWLVTFAGVAFAPSGSSASVCACSTVYQRANTIVALDAQSGSLIAVLGTDL